MSTQTALHSATFVGLLTGGATTADIGEVRVEVYRVFPKDSDVGRTSGPPTFSTAQVPTRVNSPSDVALDDRDSSGGLKFTTSTLAGSFTTLNSVQPGGIHPKPGQTTAGDGAITGEEVQFDVTFTTPFDLQADHYFFIPQVEVSGGEFLWLSAPRPIVAPGTPFPAGNTDLQAWTRDASLDPDWLRVGTDIVGPMESMPNIPSGVLASWKERGLTWVTADSAHFPGALIPQYWRDFGPRLAVAYKLTDKWVLRAGYGMYYWPMPLSQILQAARGNPPLDLRFNNHRDNLNGSFPNRALLIAPDPSSDIMPNVTVDVTGVQSLGVSSRGIFIFDPHNWADDRSQQWTVTAERQLMKETSLRLSYIGNHGSNLEQRLGWNSSESQWNYQTETGLAAPANGDLRRPNQDWNGTVESHVGYSNSQSVQAEVQRRFSNGLAFQWFYTYNHALSTTDEGGFGSGGGGALAPENSVILGNPNLSLSDRLRLVYYNSGSVPPHRITWNGIYQLPFGKGKRFAGSSSRAMDMLIGGWQVAFIGTWRSGNWLGVNSYAFGDPTLSADQRLKMNIFGKNQELYFRGDFDPTQATNVDQAKLQQLIPVDRSQRVIHPLGSSFNNRLPFQLADGTIRQTSITDLVNWTPHNFFLGPGAFNQDFSVFKYFNFTERIKLRFTSDFFNVTNHPTNKDPNGSTGLVDLSQQANDPRIIQFSLRLEF